MVFNNPRQRGPVVHIVVRDEARTIMHSTWPHASGQKLHTIPLESQQKVQIKNFQIRQMVWSLSTREQLQ